MTQDLLGPVLLRRCTCCGECKALEQFGRASKGKHRRAPKCRMCAAALMQGWRGRNPDKVKASASAYYARHNETLRARRRMAYLDQAESVREQARAFRKSHQQSINRRARERYAADPTAKRSSASRWRSENEEKNSAYANARRHRNPHSKKAPWCTWPEIAAVHRRARVLTKETGVQHQVDHVFPLRGRSVSGLTCLANLRVVPADVNAAKKHKMPGFLAHELWDPLGEGVFHE